MKKYLLIILSSIIGGIIAVYMYEKLTTEFFKKEKISNLVLTEQLPINNLIASTNLIQDRPDFVKTAENTINTVVHVKNSLSSSEKITLEDLMFGRGRDQMQIGTGSGVIINTDGYIITNNHVITNAQEISVTMNNNKTYVAELIGTDPKTDIALLKIDSNEDLPFITFADSDNAKIGEWVLAVGNPFNLTSTVTAGIISAKARDLSGTSKQSFIQTDAAVNPGNSGGALVNTNGELVGINTAISSQTGSYVGYSFAVPSNIARKVIEDIMEYGNVQNGILGIQGGALNSLVAEKIGVTDTEGIYIDRVIEDSGAEKAGVRKGDIIKEIDHIKISKFADLTGHLNTKRPSDVVNLSVLRDGETSTIPVILAKNETFTMPLVGRIKNAKPTDLKKYKASYGVKITDLNSKYADYWKRNGIQKGCIITSVNDIKVTSIDDVQNALKNQENSGALRIELINSKGEKERYNFK